LGHLSISHGQRNQGLCMTAAAIALVAGLALLIWSADRFVEGTAATARHAGMPPLMIGMVVIGFGTSAPELFVSVISSSQGNPGLAMGNAYGSNIANIALILGLTALIQPISFHSQALRKELPLLFMVTLLTAFLLWDGKLTRLDAWILLMFFGALMTWTIVLGFRHRGDSLDLETERGLSVHDMPKKQAFFWLFTGLVVLIVSSRILVWGAVEMAQWFGISDLLIGLTIVALGTSLPELASALMAARRGEHDLALGNVLGSNLFNTLAVVGIAGAIHPLAVPEEVIHRDILVMGVLTASLFVIGYGFRGPGRITRLEGGLLFTVYIFYMGWLINSVLQIY